MGNIFNLLMMICAPSNFILYCLLSKKFRGTFRKLFWNRKKAKQLETETILLSRMKSTKKFNPYKHGLMKRNQSEYHTPRNLEVNIYFFNRGKYVNTYNVCVKIWHIVGGCMAFIVPSNLPSSVIHFYFNFIINCHDMLLNEDDDIDKHNNLSCLNFIVLCNLQVDHVRKDQLFKKVSKYYSYRSTWYSTMLD